MTTDDDFERAVTGRNDSTKLAKASSETVVQKGTEMACNGQQDPIQKSPNTKANGRLRSVATGHDVSVICCSGGHGTRNSPQSSDETAILQTGGAESGALCKRCKKGLESEISNANFDPELTAIVDAWPKLSPAIRSAITALVRSAGGGNE